MTQPTSPEPELRGRILDAATRLFARQGYGSTSVRQVVEAVGCTKPMLYYYFGNKEELFLTAVQTHIAEFTGIIEEASRLEGTVASRLAWFIDRYLDQVLKNPLAMRLLMTAQHPTDAGQPQIDVMALHRFNGELLDGLMTEGATTGEIRADIDPRDASLAFIGMVNFRILNCLHQAQPPADIALRILDVFLNGVKPRPVSSASPTGPAPANGVPS